MSIFHAIVLGITQGLSEFLPISSSGHLLLVPYLFGWDDPFIESLAFSVVLHGGTLAALLMIFPASEAVVAIVNRRDRLGDILVKSSVISQGQLDAAVKLLSEGLASELDGISSASRASRRRSVPETSVASRCSMPRRTSSPTPKR